LGKQSLIGAGNSTTVAGGTSFSSRFLPESIQIKTTTQHSNGITITTTKSHHYQQQQQQQQHLDVFGNTISDGILFVPSLDYRVDGISQYDPDHNFPAHVYCDEFAKDITWDYWPSSSRSSKKQQPPPKSVPIKKKQDEGQQQQQKHHHHHSLRRHLNKEGTTTGSADKKLQKRLMIGLYSGYDDYATLLEQAVYSARVYGQIWGSNVTVVTLQGTSFAPHGCKGPSSHITLNKIRLLFHAIDNRDKYDQVLILDADSIVYNMDVDMTTLLPVSSSSDMALVAGQALHGAHKNEVWKIHSGATLWNLRHPLIASVAVDWFNDAKNGIVTRKYHNDQQYLHETLKSHMLWQQDQNRHNNNGNNGKNDDQDDSIGMVLNFQNHEFDFASGTVVKQFIKDGYNSNNSNNDRDGDDEGHHYYLNERLQQMKRSIDEICIDRQEECSVVTRPYYETS
jgi:hypothetical protein